MTYHKLLTRQVSKFISDDLLKDIALQQFLLAVNDSYNSFERDKELLNHAFSLSEKEYTDLLLSLNKEYELKKRSIEVLKQAVSNIRDELHVVEANVGEDNLMFIAAILDDEVKQRKKTEQRLKDAKLKAEESSRAKEAFLATMSHEIRTPLNAIVGMIRELASEQLTPSQMNYVSITETASQHLMSVLNNILDISKIEAGEFQLDQVHFNLQSLLRDVRSILLTKSEEKSLALNLKHPVSTDFMLVGDAVRLRQIMINLVGNAVKFTEQGSVTIAYEVEPVLEGMVYVNIGIKDTGVGMEKSYVDHVFKKFSQEDASVSRKYGGSGLGMSITRELVHLMDGEIVIDSEKNRGTTITIRLRFPVGDAAKIIDTKKPIDFKAQRTISVLLVEDNAFNRMVAVNSLKKIGCRIVETTNGKEAVEVLLKDPGIELVLMDLQMPTMDGFEATEIMRQELKSNVPIIGLTANAFKSELEHCYAVGMNAVVVKPFDEHTLLNTILDLVDSALPKMAEADDYVDDESTGLFSLDRLRILCSNDVDNIRKMLVLYVEVSNKALTELKIAVASKDYFTISQLVHKLIPSLVILAVKSLVDSVPFLENYTPNLDETERFNKEVTHFSKVLSKVSAALARVEI